MVAVANVTKQGIHRSATGVINALEPMISFVTVQLLNATAGNTQRIYFPAPINVKAVEVYRGAVQDAAWTSAGNTTGCIGWADGTDEYCFEWHVDSEESPTNVMESSRMHSSATVTRWHQTAPFSVALDRGHTLTALGVGYIDLDTTTDTTRVGNPSLPRWVTVKAYGGSEVTNVKAWAKDDLGTGTSAISISSLGFEPDMTHIGTANLATLMASYDDGTLAATSEAQFSHGWALNKTGTPQGSWGIAAENSEAAPVDLGIVLSNTKCIFVPTDALGTDFTLTASNFRATDGGAFDITPSTNAGSVICGGLALKFSDDVVVEQVDLAVPTSGNLTKAVTAKSAMGTILGNYGVTAYDTVTGASDMCQLLAVFSEKEIMCHFNSATSGGDDADIAGRGFMDRKLRAWLMNGATELLSSSGHSLTTSQWSFTLDDWPDTEFKAIGLNIGT